MAEFDLEKLQDIKVPEAKLSARQHTLQSAMSEFDEQQKQKNNFTLSNVLPDWFNPAATLSTILNPRTMLNPRIAGAFSLLVLVGLGSIIYLPEIAKQPKPEEIKSEEITKKQGVDSEENSRDKAEQEENRPAQEKPVLTPQPLATPGIQKLKKKTLPQGYSSGFGNRNVRQLRKAPSNNKPLENRKLYSAPKSSPSDKGAPAEMKIQQLGNSGNNTAIGNSSIGKAAPPIISVRTFHNPLHKGKALHHCLLAADHCGQIVADRFCASKKMGNAHSFQIKQKTATETISLQDDRIFKPTGNTKPLAFKSIACYPPAKN